MTTSPMMPRIDSNIILRYLTDEPPAQAEPVARLFDRIAAGEIKVRVDDIVIAEVVWTLSSYYKISRKETTEALLRLLSEEGIICEWGSAVQAALVIFEEKNIDFVDALLCARMLEAHGGEIYSFDHDFDRVEGVIRKEPE